MNKYNCKDIYTYYKKSGGTLAYNIFKEIIAENNKRISALVINMGYVYQVPHQLGVLKIIRNKRTIKLTSNDTIKGAVDWKKSNELKERLLEEGKTLYLCEKDDKGNIISDNGGEKWIVYRTDDSYYIWNWLSDIKLHNCIKYKFKVTWTNARDLVASKPEESELLFKETKKNGTSRSDFISKFITTSGNNVRDKQQ